MTNYKPGMIAKATVRGQADELIVRSPFEFWYSPEHRIGSHATHNDEDVTDIRPLVVLDLSPHHVMRTVEALRESRGMIALEVADMIEEQTKQARIPEPGLGAHVEARKPDGTTAEFVRVGSRHWSEIGNGSGWEWSDLKNPVLVREGVDV